MKNKYNIGDEVWYAHDGKPKKNVITGVVICRQFGSVEKSILYFFDYSDPENNYGEEVEEYLFPTKEALIQSL